MVGAGGGWGGRGGFYYNCREKFCRETSIISVEKLLQGDFYYCREKLL